MSKESAGQKPPRADSFGGFDAEREEVGRPIARSVSLDSSSNNLDHDMFGPGGFTDENLSRGGHLTDAEREAAAKRREATWQESYEKDAEGQKAMAGSHFTSGGVNREEREDWLQEAIQDEHAAAYENAKARESPTPDGANPNRIKKANSFGGFDSEKEVPVEEYQNARYAQGSTSRDDSWLKEAAQAEWEAIGAQEQQKEEKQKGKAPTEVSEDVANKASSVRAIRTKEEESSKGKRPFLFRRLSKNSQSTNSQPKKEDEKASTYKEVMGLDRDYQEGDDDQYKEVIGALQQEQAKVRGKKSRGSKNEGEDLQRDIDFLQNSFVSYRSEALSPSVEDLEADVKMIAMTGRVPSDIDNPQFNNPDRGSFGVNIAISGPEGQGSPPKLVGNRGDMHEDYANVGVVLDPSKLTTYQGYSNYKISSPGFKDEFRSVEFSADSVVGLAQGAWHRCNESQVHQMQDPGISLQSNKAEVSVEGEFMDAVSSIVLDVTESVFVAETDVEALHQYFKDNPGGSLLIHDGKAAQGEVFRELDGAAAQDLFYEMNNDIKMSRGGHAAITDERIDVATRVTKSSAGKGIERSQSLPANATVREDWGQDSAAPETEGSGATTSAFEEELAELEAASLADDASLDDVFSALDALSEGNDGANVENDRSGMLTPPPSPPPSQPVSRAGSEASEPERQTSSSRRRSLPATPTSSQPVSRTGSEASEPERQASSSRRRSLPATPTSSQPVSRTGSEASEPERQASSSRRRSLPATPTPSQPVSRVGSEVDAIASEVENEGRAGTPPPSPGPDTGASESRSSSSRLDKILERGRNSQQGSWRDRVESQRGESRSTSAEETLGDGGGR